MGKVKNRRWSGPVTEIAQRESSPRKERTDIPSERRTRGVSIQLRRQRSLSAPPATEREDGEDKPYIPRALSATTTKPSTLHVSFHEQVEWYYYDKNARIKRSRPGWIFIRSNLHERTCKWHSDLSRNIEGKRGLIRRKLIDANDARYEWKWPVWHFKKLKARWRHQEVKDIDALSVHFRDGSNGQNDDTDGISSKLSGVFEILSEENSVKISACPYGQVIALMVTLFALIATSLWIMRRGRHALPTAIHDACHSVSDIYLGMRR